MLDEEFMIPNGFQRSAGELLIGGKLASALVSEYGTPLYVYNGDIISRQFHEVRKAFPAFEIFYSLKANSNLSICALLHSLGARAEVASGGEIYLALQAGFEPYNIVFAGPGKTEQELEFGISTNIFAIHAESARELRRIALIAEKLHQNVQVALRINTREGFAEAPEVMAGGSSRFGIDEELIIPELSRFSSPRVRIIGIHVYTASQILDERAIIANFGRTLDLACSLAQNAGLDLKSIDFGGGFGVPYTLEEKKLDMEMVGMGVQTILNRKSSTYNLEHTRLILELGRYLTAASGVFLARVLDIKESRGRKYLITDGGMNQQIRPVFMKLNHPTYPVSKLDDRPIEIVDVCGPLCTPLDTLASHISMPRVEVGDIIGIFNSGAYGFSMGMLNFLSHPWPAEVLVYQGLTYLIRERGTEGDFLRGQPRHQFSASRAG